jgi:hypothetical protein
MIMTSSGRPAGEPTAETTVADDESTLVAVTRAVAAVEGVSPVDLPPLHDAVDPDALNTVVGSFPGKGVVVFPYAGYVVAARAAGVVEVYDDEMGAVDESSR